jgi:hypothetical protein
MLVALAVSSIIIAASYASYEMVATQYKKNMDIADMHTSGRAIMRIIERDVRMAGFEYRDKDAKVTYGTISSPLTIKDSGNKCCDEVTVIYDYFDEESKKVERIRIRYWAGLHTSNKGSRHRLYKQKDILGQNKKILATPILGTKDVMADYIEDLQIGDSKTINKPTDGYTKIDKNGKELPDSANKWSCVKDNKTGLIWEAKTNDSSEHDRTTEFDWYDSNPSTNGGYAGFNSKNTRKRLSRNTEQFVINVNNERLCSYSQWSLPTFNQLLTLYSKKYASSPYNFNIRINKNYFPLVQRGSGYWSSTQANHRMFVRYLSFDSGDNGGIHKSSGIYVMLVAKGNSSGIPKLVVISLTLRTKNQTNRDRRYQKKDYHAGNYKLDKTDKYKRDTFSSTVLVRNLAL